jgi:acetyltransferase EpsM
MILFGASGHAKVIMDIVHKQGASVSHLLDDNPDIQELLGKRVITFSPALDLTNEHLVVSIGVNKIRKIVVQKLNTQFACAFHPAAMLDDSVNVDEGTVVMAGAVINSSTSIGKHAIINTGATVDHDCELEDFVHISPNATLCGDVTVGEGTHVGAGAIIIPGVKIGNWVTVGAGAVVIRDIPDRAVVVGNPARIIKYND